MTDLAASQIDHGVLVPSFLPATDLNAVPIATVTYQGAPASLGFENDRLVMTIPSPGNDVTESWIPTSGRGLPPTDMDQDESGVAWIRSDDHLFAAALLPDQPVLEYATYAAYVGLLTLCERLGFDSIYRIWNYVGCINDANSRGLERYRDFCLGRATAFEDLSFAPSVLPAATGIGFKDGGAAVFLIAKRSLEAANIENPLQIPAYEYPELYGPKPPSFARATVVSAAGERILYVSGTSSIRDHRTVGTDLQSHLDVTTENIRALIGAAEEVAWEKPGSLAHGAFDSLKIYVRRESDAARVSDHFRSVFDVTPERSPVFHSDICRSELILEVEGVFRAKVGS